MSRPKILLVRTDEHCTLTLSGGGGIGGCHYFSVNLMLIMQYFCM